MVASDSYQHTVCPNTDPGTQAGQTSRQTQTLGSVITGAILPSPFRDLMRQLTPTPVSRFLTSADGTVTHIARHTLDTMIGLTGGRPTAELVAEMETLKTANATLFLQLQGTQRSLQAQTELASKRDNELEPRTASSETAGSAAQTKDDEYIPLEDAIGQLKTRTPGAASPTAVPSDGLSQLSPGELASLIVPVTEGCATVSPQMESMVPTVLDAIASKLVSLKRTDPDSVLAPARGGNSVLEYRMMEQIRKGSEWSQSAREALARLAGEQITQTVYDASSRPDMAAVKPALKSLANWSPSVTFEEGKISLSLNTGNGESGSKLSTWVDRPTFKGDILEAIQKAESA